MKETLRHQEAFNYYYSLGDTRSIPKVVHNQKVSVASLKRWSVEFKWQERIVKRDKKMGVILANQTDKAILKTKSDYQKEIQESLVLIRGALAVIAQKMKDGLFKAETAKDLGTLIKAQDAAIRLEQLLSGEADSREEHKLIVQYVDPEPVAKLVESEIVDGGFCGPGLVNFKEELTDKLEKKEI